jgi:4-carboxymuconolactone decarboxylase
MKTSRGMSILGVLVLCLALTGCATVGNGEQERKRLAEPRLKPLAESEWTAEQRQILNNMRVGGKVFNIFATSVRNPQLTKVWEVFGMYLVKGSSLPPRDRELLILRMGWLCRSEYEFGQHTMVAKMVGLKPEEISRIVDGPDAPGWTPFERAILRATDELHADAFITDATYNELAKQYDEKQLIDFVMTAGQYVTVSMFLNTFGVPMDQGLPGFPKAAQK